MKEILIILVPIIIFLIPTIIAVMIIKKHAYECDNCNKQFNPSCKNVLLSVHSDNKRYLKCPYCNKRSWCKEVTTK